MLAAFDGAKDTAIMLVLLLLTTSVLWPFFPITWHMWTKREDENQRRALYRYHHRD